MSDLEALAEAALTAGEAAGAYLRGRFAEASIAEERRRDVKLLEDAQAEAIILERLASTGVPIFAEESAEQRREAARSDRFWVVDPLDGSFNFSRGFDRCVVSIGLVEAGRPVLGVIVDFMRGQAFVGMSGSPARDQDGEAVRVSAVDQLSEAALLTGLPAQRDFSPASMEAFSRGLSRVKKVRMLGSAASSLLLVARGVFDIYVEDDIMIWDVAAGAALVEAAGGAVRMTQSSRIEGAVRLVAAADQRLIEDYDAA
ncbi:MAG: inositol monophosphatase [Alphaproteobacteria bacterium]|nr:inositol monophosphatase [Alphaproteobacteria bacterium]